MINPRDVLDTIRMIDRENLDIRTVTMGISLLSCVCDDMKVLSTRVYDTVMGKARNLVKVANEIEEQFGIPIVNKRVSVTPIALIAGATNEENYTPLAEALDRAAKELGIDFIGGFSALVHKGTTKSDLALIKSIPEALTKTNYVCSSVNVGTTRAGINMDAVKMMGEAIKEAAERTRERDGIGAAKLVAFCNAVEDNPFMAGAFHGIGEADCVINVGVSGPGVV
ncbi:DUF711 family protein, partial [Christensenellaceae bacterium OttesenSCG-928-M15]|nr:DUF711 family protein [Christensenellaceae bacterium OttesenSCG-928-M15]